MLVYDRHGRIDGVLFCSARVLIFIAEFCQTNLQRSVAVLLLYSQDWTPLQPPTLVFESGVGCKRPSQIGVPIIHACRQCSFGG